MKNIQVIAFIFTLLLLGCNQSEIKISSKQENKTANLKNDKEQIKTLIKQVLSWSNSKESIDLLPI